VLLQSARITLKQHRFEVGAAVLAALLIGAAALWVNSRLTAVHIPAGCFDAAPGFDLQGSNCDRLFRERTKAGGEASTVLGWMAILPWAAGLLGGVTLVGRELEARTAQTAWALAASRRRWLGRQLWPILVVLGVTVGFAAMAGSILSATRSELDPYLWLDLGAHGPLVMARAFAALGLGVLIGAALGRTLPAFVAGAVLSIAFVVGSVVAREGWVNLQPQIVIEQTVAESRSFRGLIFEQGWRLPDGSILPDSAARDFAPADGSVDPNTWLLDRGYQVVYLGITAETQSWWEPLETAGSALVGVVLLLGAVAIVDRRRPT
jgi:ABC-type transport system involved in multi-copper enzyme maturation permease subunit